MKKEEEKIMKKEENKIMKKEESKMMKEEVKGLKKEEDKMKKEEDKMKELVKEIEAGKLLLVEKVFKWAQGLCPMKNVHVKIKGRYYPLIEKESGKICLIDKVQGKKIGFNSLEESMKYVIASVLAERKEEIEKEVEEGQRKFLERKLREIDELINKF